jgi:hypothetical protein
MSRLISRAELARRAGVSKPAITKACKSSLREACERDRIDFDHPAVAAYLKAKQPSELAGKGSLGGSQKAVAAPPADVAPTTSAKPARRRVASTTPPAGRGQESPAPAAPAPTSADMPDEELEREALDDKFEGSAEDLTRIARSLRPVISRFGTRRGLKDWLDALNKLEEIRKKRLDNEETEGRLISRELVKTHVFGAIEGANRRLLGDFPKTITRLLYASANAKESIEVAEEKVRSAVTQILKPVKATATRVVEDA